MLLIGVDYHPSFSRLPFLTKRQGTAMRTSQGGSEATILFDRSSDQARGVVRGIPGTKKETQAGVEGVAYQKG
jgi:hypothetical protein